MKRYIYINLVIGLLVFVGVGVSILVSSNPDMLASWLEPLFGKETSPEQYLDIFLPAFIVVIVLISMLAGFYPLIKMGINKGKKKKILLERGQRALGKVLEVKDTGITVNNNPHIKMTIEVRPGFTTELSHTVSRISVPRPGDQVEIVYDPANPEDVLLASDLG